MAKKTKTPEPRLLFKFYADCGRMGSVDALFTATQTEVDGIIGKTVYFGEILGKHSEVFFPMEREHFKVLTDDASFVSKFDEFGCGSGHNPFDYLDEGEETNGDDD